jgi:hypothetical protein
MALKGNKRALFLPAAIACFPLIRGYNLRAPQVTPPDLPADGRVRDAAPILCARARKRIGWIYGCIAAILRMPSSGLVLPFGQPPGFSAEPATLIGCCAGGVGTACCLGIVGLALGTPEPAHWPG